MYQVVEFYFQWIYYTILTCFYPDKLFLQKLQNITAPQAMTNKILVSQKLFGRGGGYSFSDNTYNTKATSRGKRNCSKK